MPEKEKVAEQVTKEVAVATNLKRYVSAAALSYADPKSKKFDQSLEKLKTLLPDGAEIRQIEPFFKEDGSEANSKNHAGYVIKTSENEVMIIYHGVQFDKFFAGGKEFINALSISTTEMKFGNANLKVHSGFKSEYDLSRNSLMEVLETISDKNPKLKLNFIGHSLGGALTQIAALDFATNMSIKGEISNVTTFGCPLVFSKSAVELYKKKELDARTSRITIKGDLIPDLFASSSFEHVGANLLLDSTRSGVHMALAYIKAVEESSVTKENNSIQTYTQAIQAYAKRVFGQEVGSLDPSQTFSGLRSLLGKALSSSNIDSVPSTTFDKKYSSKSRG